MTTHAAGPYARLPLLIGLMLLALLLVPLPAGARGGSGPRAAAPPDKESKSEPAPPPKVTPIVVPDSAKGRKNPVPNVPEAIEAGKNLYTSQCAMCHGARGDGKGDIAPRLSMPVPDLTTPQIQARRTDGEWFYILSHGHAEMPAEDRLHEQNKWEIIHYLRTLKRAAPSR
ncbi:MAG TPA: cytochrome c [Candidatus Polarisedimenticolia bacterium]|nr:cytochrome c [Candidatus Polarisedimenticolia bacterium]